MIRKEFPLGQKDMFYKSRRKGLLGKWKSRKFGLFIVSEVFAGGTVELIGLEYVRTFIMKGKKLRSYGGSEYT